MRINKWISENANSLKDKTVAISGATGGLGNALCEHLASLGANLLLLDRNSEKSKALGKRLLDGHPNIEISYIRVDLENFEDVRSATEQLKQLPIDYLILNAGAYHIPRHKCDTGYDNVFQINFLSPYYMARELMPYIKERRGRIVAVGSIAHNYSKIDPENIDFTGITKSSLAYGNAKRYLMYSLFAISDDETIAVAHPGITFTNITSHYPKLVFAIIKYPMKIIFMNPNKASLSILNGIFTPTRKNEWIGPRFFNIWGIPSKKRLTSCDENEAMQIADIAEKIYSEIR